LQQVRLTAGAGEIVGDRTTAGTHGVRSTRWNSGHDSATDRGRRATDTGGLVVHTAHDNSAAATTGHEAADDAAA
jgi:hypothetical protein